MESGRPDDDLRLLTESLGQLPELVARPVFVAVSGLPGTGKSYFCQKLSERLRLVVLESDALRKVLFPTPDYSAQESARLFQATHRLIEELLKKGISVALDATNLSEVHREYLYSIADRLDIKLVLVRIEAPLELVKERLASRRGVESNSNADWMVYQRMKSSVEKIRRRHYVVDTSKDISPVLDKIVKELSR